MGSSKDRAGQADAFRATEGTCLSHFAKAAAERGGTITRTGVGHERLVFAWREFAGWEGDRPAGKRGLGTLGGTACHSGGSAASQSEEASVVPRDPGGTD